MINPSEPRTEGQAYHNAHDAGAPTGLDPGAALAITCGAVATFLAVAILAPRSVALVAGQLAQAGIALAAAHFVSSGRGLATVGLRAPRAAHVVAALLLGASCWYVELWIVDAITWSTAQERQARALADAVRDPPLAVVLAQLALVPALCEELVFRGVLARGLATRLPPVAAAAGSALLFAAYHLSAVQAIPTFLLGIALGLLALRARSIVPAMIAHALNNALVIAVTRDDRATQWLDDHAGAALAAAALLVAGGGALAAGSEP